MNSKTTDFILHGGHKTDMSFQCEVCKDRKTLPVFDEYNGMLRGSRKCWKCNGGDKYYDPFWNY